MVAIQMYIWSLVKPALALHMLQTSTIYLAAGFGGCNIQALSGGRSEAEAARVYEELNKVWMEVQVCCPSSAFRLDFEYI